MIVVLYFIGIVFFLFMQAFFAAGEIAFISSSLMRLRHRKEKGDKRAAQVYRMMARPEKFLATVLVGINLSVVISTALLTALLVSMGVSNGSLWVTALFTPLVVVFAELVPKDIGRYYREEFSCRAIGIFNVFAKAFRPASVGLEAVNRILVRIFIKNAKVRSPFVTREEIRSLLNEIKSEGAIDTGEQQAIEEVIDFKNDKVSQVYVPLVKTAAIGHEASRQDVVNAIGSFGYTRYPVFKGKHIIGYINAYDIFYEPQVDWRRFIRPILRISYDANLYEAFSRLKKKKESIAVIVRGKASYGIVTLRDLMRAIIVSLIH